MRIGKQSWIGFIGLSLLGVGCNQPPPAAQEQEALKRHAGGAVYAMANGVGNNQIVVYRRGADGRLTLADSVATGGGGSGAQLDGVDPLGSQSSVLLHPNRRFLYAVNTNIGSENAQHDCHQGSISVFQVASDGGLTLLGSPIPSGGLFPNSLTTDGERLFVLNAGGPDTCTGRRGFNVNPNITGFEIDWDGRLERIPGSTRTINPGIGDEASTCVTAAFGPGSECGLNPPHPARAAAQVAFSPWGDSLVVPVKGTDSIYVFPVRWWDGLPGQPTVWRAPGPQKPFYFGASFDLLGHLLITEPLGTASEVPAPGASAVSSFDIGWDGTLTPISKSVASGQTEACWIALEPFSKEHAYITNTHGNSISVYGVGLDGALTYLPAAEQHLADGALPNEIVSVADSAGRFAYSLHSGTGKVGMFAIQADGTLAPIGEIDGLPANAGAEGMAAF
jgi:6-phosphogluconolactonase (cycloisomerase 2 family)